jgi:hypothetical protein
MQCSLLSPQLWSRNPRSRIVEVQEFSIHPYPCTIFINPERALIDSTFHFRNGEPGVFYVIIAANKKKKSFLISCKEQIIPSNSKN